MIVFYYRARAVDAWQPAHARKAVRLEEQTEYILRFRDPPDAAVQRKLNSLGGAMLAPGVASVDFGNFVGLAELAGVSIEVVSKKVGPAGVCRLLEEISKIGTNLIFGWQGRTRFAAAEDTARLAPVPFHQLLFIRDAVLQGRPGQRLTDWLSTIERSPTRRLEPHRPYVRIDQVRRIDHGAMASIFSHIDRLIPTRTSGKARHPLARALTFGRPPQPHFPAAAAAPGARISYDTPENRFVKHVVGESLAIVQRFAGRPKLSSDLASATCRLLEILSQADRSPVFNDVGRLTSFSAPSQALLKADGYLQVFDYWSRLTRHVSLPLHAAEVTRFIDGKDIATLFEYWTFAKIVAAVAEILHAPPATPVIIQRHEFGETLSLGFRLPIGAAVTVNYNQTYSRTAGTAYSTPLRPDVTVAVREDLYAFDAKFKLRTLNADDDDADEDGATYKRADLYKMHAYRDAITGLRSAFVVYPGSEFVYFQRGGGICTDAENIDSLDGVGAIPLPPSAPRPDTTLKNVLAKLLSQGFASGQ